MTSHQLDEERIFHLARQQPNAAARNEYLDQICAGDQALRERVEALLQVHEQEQEFLKSGNPSPDETVDHKPILEGPGVSIGRYKLMEQIGEGGMGTVFVAQQERPLRRRVALKVIKPGMDSKSVIARFEAERQALALMDHPNIAKVLDAGATDYGRPYFAMELVKGIPITEYCDKNKLTVDERLELFMLVCQAIQHAHQKGIIHRDIKPSNVLVTLHDGKPVPKVIDFGIAKALNARLTDKSIYTEHFQIVGTLLYMAPEQAEMSGLGVDTRSDVYSLGVLLYELLTGTTPFQKAELDQAGFDEQRRIIREQEPPRASARISSLGETATTVAEHRRTDARKLNQLVRGDLDWIMHKALEKDRTRRYESPKDFAQDVSDYLADEPVKARPPTIGYRAAKYVRRNRVSIAVVGLLLASLALGLIGTISQARRAEREAAAAREAQDKAERSRDAAQNAFARVDRILTVHRRELAEKAFEFAMYGNRSETEALLEKLKVFEASQELLDSIRGVLVFYAGDQNDAVELFEGVLGKDATDLIALSMLAIISGYNGQWAKSEVFSKQALAQSPANDIERLFQAYVWLYADYRVADQKLKKIISHRGEWTVARTLYAALLGHRALAEVDLRQASHIADQALSEAAVVESTAPDNPFVLAVSLFLHTTALLLPDHSGDEDLREHARQLEAQLRSKHPNYRLGRAIVGEYAIHRGQYEIAIEEFEEAGVFPDSLAILYFRQTDVSLARRVYETRGDLHDYPGYWISHSLVSIGVHNDELWNWLDKWGPKGRWFNLGPEHIGSNLKALAVPLLLGDVDLAKQRAGHLLPIAIAADAKGLPVPLLKYIDGEDSQDQLVKALGDSRENLSHAWYWIALKELALGHRENAMDSMRRCLALKNGVINSTLWCDALLKRMTEDEAWPEWIPAND